MRRIGVLASGSGTILRALVAAELPVTVVVTDRDCAALEVARTAGIAAELVARESFGADFDRLDHTRRVVEVLEGHEVDLVAMAGYGTILEAPIHDAFGGRIVNTHPALLPAFKGWHAVDDALAAGVHVTGCTVHLATLEVDDGPILAQETVPVLPDDTVATLHERIKAVERRLYPEVLRTLIADQGGEPIGEPTRQHSGVSSGEAWRSNREPRPTDADPRMSRDGGCHRDPAVGEE